MSQKAMNSKVSRSELRTPGGTTEQKALGFLLLFFLALVYKATVWDPYMLRPSQRAGDQSAPVAQTQPTTAPSGVVPSIQPAVPQLAVPGAIPGVASGAANPSDGQIAEAGIYRVVTRSMTAEVSALGGRITKLFLHHYRTEAPQDSPRLNLVEHVEFAPYPLGVISGGVEDTWVPYSVTGTVNPAPADGVRGSFDVSQVPELDLKLTGTLPDGRQVFKTLRFRSEGYLVEVEAGVSAAPADMSRIELEWTKLLSKDSPSLLDPYNTAGIVAFDGHKATRTRFDKFPVGNMTLGNTHWVGLTDKYFSVSLISPSEPRPSVASHQGELFRVRQGAEPTRGGFQIFAGPKSYPLLQEAGFSLERNIDFGIFSFLAIPLLTLLRFFESFLGNYGLAIIALTILVRSALLPLSIASFKQMRAMNDLKPEVDRIRKEVTDKQQQQIELMSLYKKRGVNPLGGCLPMLVQIPIFLGLYNALLAAIELRHAPFALWIHDLSAPEGLMVGGVGIPVLVILFVGSMLLQQKLTPTTGMDPVQQKMMMIMPVIFGFMFISFPAGLTLYYLTSNIISIGQSAALRSDSKMSPSVITAAVSFVTLLFAWLLTVIS